MSSLRAIAIALGWLFCASALNGVEILDDEFDDTFTLSPNAAISMTNTDGSIRIYAADVSEVHVHAIKHAYTSERLNGINIIAKATSDSLTIETQFPPKKSPWSFSDQSGTVDYMLVVPMTTRIARCDLVNGEILIEGLQGGSAKAHLVNGWLGGHNCFADLELSIVNGRLDIAYDWWQSENSAFKVNATGENGNLRALLPPDASISLNAESKEGKVANAFADDSDEADVEVRKVNFTIGDEQRATLTLRAKNGNIRIDRSY